MASVYTTLTYWLVNNPYIANYTWTEGETLGSTVFFVSVVVSIYLSVTFFLRHAIVSLPSLSPRLLKPITAVHSLILCILSLIMALGCTLSVTSDPTVRLFHTVCFPVDVKPKGPLFFWGQVFYLSKILEFGDTVIIILGKAYHRLSFLHVYHHATVVVMCFIWLRTRQSMFPVGLVTNSTVHVAMYGYYFLCAVGWKPKWKRLVTDFQVVQFVFGFGISTLMFPEQLFGSGCSGVWGCCFTGAFNASLLVLFFNFRSKNYVDKTKLEMWAKKQLDYYFPKEVINDVGKKSD